MTDQQEAEELEKEEPKGCSEGSYLYVWPYGLIMAMLCSNFGLEVKRPGTLVSQVSVSVSGL